MWLACVLDCRCVCRLLRCSDTVTRLLDTSMVAVNDVLPSDSRMAATIMQANTIAMANSSCHPRIVNVMSEAMVSPVTAHPSGDIYEVTSRLMRCLMRRRDRCMVLLRCMVLDCRILDLSRGTNVSCDCVLLSCCACSAAALGMRFRRWRLRSVRVRFRESVRSSVRGWIRRTWPPR